MARIRPVTFVWNGNNMVPLPRFKRQCDEQFVVDEEYPLTILEARSRASHNHYFACVHEAWVNLPEDVRYRVDPETGEAIERFPSEEHLRKWALVKAGFCQHHAFPCASAIRASEMAAFLRTKDSYAVMTIEGDVLNIFEADSQSASAMGREQFQKSKDAVLEILSDMIRTKPAELQKMGDQHFRREPKRSAR
jgi:hypothetical protein